MENNEMDKLTDYDPQTAYHSSNKGNHRHEVKLDHGHQATMNSNPAHAHSLASQSHNHPDSAHSHSVNNEPEYYQLAFIYLEGENEGTVFDLFFPFLVNGSCIYSIGI